MICHLGPVYTNYVLYVTKKCCHTVHMIVQPLSTLGQGALQDEIKREVSEEKNCRVGGLNGGLILPLLQMQIRP